MQNTFQPFVDKYFPIIFPIYFVALWCLVCAVISILGGWFSLSEDFRAQKPFEGTRVRMRSGRMRWLTSYNNMLTVGANQHGLYLACLFLFRFMHPPLLIPWNEIKVRREQGLIFKYVSFVLGRELRIPLRIRAELAETLRSSAGGSWPIEEL
jgi:hypothetical protein